MPEPIASNSAQRILLVDDDPLMCDYLHALLTGWDYTVATRYSAESALRLLDSDQAFDLLFTDIRLRGALDGWDLARHTRLLRPDVAILFTSASADIPARAIIGQGRLHPLLLKPYHPRDLAAALQIALPDR